MTTKRTKRDERHRFDDAIDFLREAGEGQQVTGIVPQWFREVLNHKALSYYSAADLLMREKLREEGKQP